VEVQPEVAPDNLALAAAVAAAMQFPENAATVHKASLANFSGYNPLGSSADAGTEEITMCGVGVGVLSLDELLQRVHTQVVSTSDGLIAYRFGYNTFILTRGMSQSVIYRIWAEAAETLSVDVHGCMLPQQIT
jgi:hypothetical protein